MSLELAIKLAKTNPIKSKGRTSISRFAAVLTDGYRTFIGFNSYKSHPLQAKYAKEVGTPEKIHIHAEIASIAEAAQKTYADSFRRGKVKRGQLPEHLGNFKLYIARVLADDSPACAKPCEGCMAAIREFGITQVEWTE